MAGTIVTDRIESDASYASSINIASPMIVSNTINMNGGSITGNVNFDSGTLFVNATNDRVGIGLTSPAAKLDVAFNGNSVTGLKMADTAGGNLAAYAQFFNTSGTQTASIQNANNDGTHLNVGTGGSLCFSSGYVSANALDDYEEGTWTPTGPTGFPGGGISVSIGTYTKIGNVVHAFGFMTAKNDGTTMMIGGLPFATSYYEAISLSHETLTVRYERMLSGESTIRFVFSATQTGTFQEIFIQATYRAS